MKWNENKFRGYNSVWVLEDYPFLVLVLRAIKSVGMN